MGYSRVGVRVRVLADLVGARLRELVRKDIFYKQAGDLVGVGVLRHTNERIGYNLIRSGPIYGVLVDWAEAQRLAVTHGTVAQTMSEGVPGEPRHREGRGE
jgi:hypothetical protein